MKPDEPVACGDPFPEEELFHEQAETGQGTGGHHEEQRGTTGNNGTSLNFMILLGEGKGTGIKQSGRCKLHDPGGNIWLTVWGGIP